MIKLLHPTRSACFNYSVTDYTLGQQGAWIADIGHVEISQHWVQDFWLRWQ